MGVVLIQDGNSCEANHSVSPASIDGRGRYVMAVAFKYAPMRPMRPDMKPLSALNLSWCNSLYHHSSSPQHVYIRQGAGNRSRSTESLWVLNR